MVVMVGVAWCYHIRRTCTLAAFLFYPRSLGLLTKTYHKNTALPAHSSNMFFSLKEPDAEARTPFFAGIFA